MLDWRTPNNTAVTLAVQRNCGLHNNIFWPLFLWMQEVEKVVESIENRLSFPMYKLAISLAFVTCSDMLVYVEIL